MDFSLSNVSLSALSQRVTFLLIPLHFTVLELAFYLMILCFSVQARAGKDSFPRFSKAFLCCECDPAGMKFVLCDTIDKEYFGYRTETMAKKLGDCKFRTFNLRETSSQLPCFCSHLLDGLMVQCPCALALLFTCMGHSRIFLCDSFFQNSADQLKYSFYFSLCWGYFAYVKEGVKVFQQSHVIEPSF